MPYSDWDGKIILHSWGRCRITVTAAVKAGDLLNFDGDLADGDVPTKATCVACEDGDAGVTIWAALAVEVRKPPTIAAGGAVTRGNHGGAADTILFLSTIAGELTATAPTTKLKQPCALVLSQDTYVCAPFASMVFVEAAAFEATPSAAAHAAILGNIGLKLVS